MPPRPCRRKPCPIRPADPTATQPSPGVDLVLLTSPQPDRLNIYGFPSQGWFIGGFDVTNDLIGIYVGDYSLPIFREAGLKPNATILAEQFKSINGPLPEPLFLSNASVIDSSDRFMYSTTTGELFFDRDGSGSAAPVKIANLDAKLSLSHTNIFAFDNFSTAPGRNNLLGGPGNDIFSGLGGTDRLDGGAGDDILNGGAGNDRQTTSDPSGLLGGEGNDILHGNQGNDSLSGENGDDILHGGQGNDEVFGDAGNDRLSGSIGNDQLLGEQGDDFLNGDQGSDRINGGDGEDELIGGEGKDGLVGGSDNDILNGGKGADVFVLERGGGRDIIQDYKDSEDWIGLPQNLDRPSEFIRFQDLTLSNQGRDTLISLGSESLAILKNVRPNELQAFDFVPQTDFVSRI